MPSLSLALNAHMKLYEKSGWHVELSGRIPIAKHRQQGINSKFQVPN